MSYSLKLVGLETGENGATKLKIPVSRSHLLDEVFGEGWTKSFLVGKTAKDSFTTIRHAMSSLPTHYVEEGPGEVNVEVRSILLTLLDIASQSPEGIWSKE